jgi:hypothetical protein
MLLSVSFFILVCLLRDANNAYYRPHTVAVQPLFLFNYQVESGIMAVKDVRIEISEPISSESGLLPLVHSFMRSFNVSGFFARRP